MNPDDKEQTEAPQEGAEADRIDSPMEDTSQEDPEAEARKMGWVPQKEFRGPKEQWRDADEFVERGRTILPIIRSQLDKEREKNAALADKMERMQQENTANFKRLEQMSDLALAKQREQLTDQYGARKEQAVERGDIDAYRAAEKAESAALKDLNDRAAPAEEKKGPTSDLPASVKAAVEGWLVDNPWFRSDPEMAAVASAYHERLLKDQPGLTLPENLDKVRARVREKYPEKFGIESNGEARASKVEGGSRSGGGGGRGLYSKLPAEAKAVADRQANLYLKRGETLEKDEAKAKERWAKVFFEQPGT